VTAAIGRRSAEWLPALGVLVAMIGLWEGLVKALHVKRFLLPAPDAIWRAFASNQSLLWRAGWWTFQEAFGGFAIGCIAGILLAVVVARFDLLGHALMPYAIAANAVPIVAFAPITNAWFNPLDKSSKMAIAAVLCFFPVFVNVVRGLRSVKPQQLELMRSYAVGELTVFRLVRVPTALPYLFTALKISATASIVGAIIGESPTSIAGGLGGAILNFAQFYSFQPQNLWATNIIAAALGIAFFLVVVGAERLVLRHAPENVA
jgi:NitT/TauT family transport system permease protein